MHLREVVKTDKIGKAKPSKMCYNVLVKTGQKRTGLVHSRMVG